MDRVVLPCRFALHSGYDSLNESNRSQSHIDCFVAHPDMPLLITYEIDLVAIEWIKSGLTNQEVIFRVLEAIPDRGAVGAIRKKDHRSIYWSFEGMVSGGRGRLEHLGYGLMSFSPGSDFPDQIWLTL